MITNGEIASALAEMAVLTALAEGSPQSFRVRAYDRAARVAEALAEPLATMSEPEIIAMRGLGKGTARAIAELVATGCLAKLEDLRRRFPPEFIELTRIPGVGPKTALLLREHLHVEGVADLQEALARRVVRDVPGLGAKTEENIAKAISRLGIGGKERRTPIIDAMRVARDITAALESVEGVTRAEAMGSLRRFRESVGDLDVLAVSQGDAAAVMQRFVSLPAVREVVSYGARAAAVLSAAGIRVDLRVVRPEQFGAATLYFTGSKAHNVALRRRALERGWTLNEYGLTEQTTGRVIAAATEEEVYRELGLAWIPPELREDTGEIELSERGALPDLVAEEHLRGDLHVHTDLSGDGREPVQAMLAGAAARRYEYVAITDHGEDLTINGATREELMAQRRNIDALRSEHPDLAVLQGAELNIAVDGSVDYDPGFLAGLDWGVASVHSHFELDRRGQTERVVEAMRNPAVNVIGHLTGRRIGRRPGIDLDVDAVLTAAETTGCAIEINCHLDRLDAPPELLRRARGSGVVFVISTDAHDTRELGNTIWGVRAARRGWVERERVANTWPAERFLAWAAAKRTQSSR
jgi:DNA polymerase (family 10)